MEREAKPAYDATRSTEWFDQGECLAYDPNIFSENQPSAKKICRGCNVRAECLSHALDTKVRHGTWGGFTDKERKSLPEGYASIDIAREAIRREASRREAGDALARRQNQRRESGRR